MLACSIKRKVTQTLKATTVAKLAESFEGVKIWMDLVLLECLKDDAVDPQGVFAIAGLLQIMATVDDQLQSLFVNSLGTMSLALKLWCSIMPAKAEYSSDIGNQGGSLILELVLSLLEIALDTV